MPRGDKSSYSDKQKRQAEHIEKGYEHHGVGKGEAERRARRQEKRIGPRQGIEHRLVEKRRSCRRFIAHPCRAVGSREEGRGHSKAQQVALITAAGFFLRSRSDRIRRA